MFGPPIIDPDDPDVREIRGRRRRKYAYAGIGVVVAIVLWGCAGLLTSSGAFDSGGYGGSRSTRRQGRALLAVLLGPPVAGASVYYFLARREERS